MTPAMAANVTDRLWLIGELIESAMEESAATCELEAEYDYGRMLMRSGAIPGWGKPAVRGSLSLP
jgi:hypothetical protein